MKKNIVALVPMRHRSERIPGKNHRLIAGKPLFHYILTTLQSCSEVDRVVVNTDSSIIIRGLREHFPQVTILERPQHLRGEEVPMNEVLLYDTSQIEADFYLQTHTTNPLVRSETISRAVHTFQDHYPEHDSLFSVTRLQSRLWNQLGHAINHNPNILLRTQDLPPVFEENSCLYIFTQETLVRRRNRLGERPLMFEIDASEAWDIDEDLDFQIVAFLLQKRQND